MKIEKKKILNEHGHPKGTTIWSIEVDYTNLTDLENLANKIKSQIGSLRAPERGTTKQKRFDACVNIYNTDISDLYKNLNLDKNPIYYVYAHCSDNKIAIGKDGVTSWAATIGMEYHPFYIGKGTGNRAYDIGRNETHRKVKQKLRAFDRDVKVKIIQDGLTELEALCLESKLIDIFGVIGKGGKLVNLDEGVNSEKRQERYIEDLAQINSFYMDLMVYKNNKI